MKVLCTIDFSQVSINACNWISAQLNNVEGSELHLCHFIHYQRRASMFISVDEIFIERARRDMDKLVIELESKYPKLQTKVLIFNANPKDGIVNISKRKNYDLIVTGTTGLNALKNMTIGSVTEYIFNHSSVPVLAIPEKVSSQNIANIAVAVDDEPIKRITPLTFIRDLSIILNASVTVVHVTEENESPFEYDPAVDMIFRKVDFVYDRLAFDTSLTNTLNQYCDENDIDMLCMIHHKRSWIRKIFHKSITKSELFNIELPLLVLNDK